MSKEALAKLETIAKEACNIGEAEIGRGWEWLTTHIRVYTAQDGNHQSAEIFDIGVALFRPASFSFTADQYSELDSIATKAADELAAYKLELDSRDTNEAERQKLERIESLKNQLKELESPDNKQEA